MKELNRKKLVVILDKHKDRSQSELVQRFRDIPGIEVAGDSKSFIDLIASLESVNMMDLLTLVEQSGSELHFQSTPELIEPIKPPKAQFD